MSSEHWNLHPPDLGRRKNIPQLEASKGGGEMALERPPMLLRVGDRSPDDDAVGPALLNVNDVDRSILARPLAACLHRRRPKMLIARAQRPMNIRS